MVRVSHGREIPAEGIPPSQIGKIFLMIFRLTVEKSYGMGLPALSATGASLLSKLEGLTSVKSSKTSSTPHSQAGTTNDASSVSNPGMFFSQLQTLSQQNPAEFKKITAQVAQQLQAVSGSSAGSTSALSGQSGLLSQMASNFQHASKTGSFSDLFTHSSQSAQASSSTASSQPHQQYADANGASDATTISNVFSQALSQIKSDLGTNAALSVVSI